MQFKKSILFLTPYPAGEAPSQRFRFEQYLPLLSQNGISYTISPFWDKKSWSTLYTSGHTLAKLAGFMRGVWRRMVSVTRLGSYSFIFIHREAMPLGPPVFEWLAFILGKKIIYDFDDAIWLPNTSAENKIAAWLKWHGKVKSICRWSTVVSCGNEFLCNYVRQVNKNVVLNPTTIATQHLHNPELYKSGQHELLTIGWTGTHSTLKYIEFLQPVIQTLTARFPNTFRFVIIANKKPDMLLDSWEFLPWNKETEISDLLKFDIGVMPLTDDIWAKGKCGFKALQYMALGIPCVVSPVGVNAEIVDHGKSGLLASSSEEWTSALEQLITNKNLRDEFGKRGREKVIQEFSVQSNSLNFLTLFS